MKILVCSDNHSNYQKIIELNELYKNQIDLKIHLGDSEFTNSNIDLLNDWKCCLGNMDFHNEKFKPFQVIKADDISIFATHGHLFSIWNNNMLNKVIESALDYKCNIILHGHTHIPSCKKVDNLVIINPGSISEPRNKLAKTYAILEVRFNIINVKFFDSSHNIVGEYEF